jgi:hypothetical protein
MNNVVLKGELGLLKRVSTSGNPKLIASGVSFLQKYTLSSPDFPLKDFVVPLDADWVSKWARYTASFGLTPSAVHFPCYFRFEVGTSKTLTFVTLASTITRDSIYFCLETGHVTTFSTLPGMEDAEEIHL